MAAAGISSGIRRAHRLLEAAYMDKRPAVTIPQLAVLQALQKHGPLNQTQLVPLSGSDRSTMALMVKRLAHGGFVSRLRDEGADDARQVIVTIQPPGLRAIPAAEAALHDAEFQVLKPVPRMGRPALRRALAAIGSASDD